MLGTMSMREHISASLCDADIVSPGIGEVLRTGGLLSEAVGAFDAKHREMFRSISMWTSVSSRAVEGLSVQ